MSKVINNASFESDNLEKGERHARHDQNDILDKKDWEPMTSGNAAVFLQGKSSYCYATNIVKGLQVSWSTDASE